MPRFVKQRFVQFPPAAVLFKPQGVPLRTLEQIVLGLDEYEVLRLVDYEGRDIETAAESLRVSRATAGRILESARKKSAEAICRGKAILIEGGTVVVGGQRFRCDSCGVMWEDPVPVEETAVSGAEIPPCPSCAATAVVDLGSGWRGGGGQGRHGRQQFSI